MSSKSAYMVEIIIQGRKNKGKSNDNPIIIYKNLRKNNIIFFYRKFTSDYLHMKGTVSHNSHRRDCRSGFHTRKSFMVHN